jgi:hypothetical protein
MSMPLRPKLALSSCTIDNNCLTSSTISMSQFFTRPRASPTKPQALSSSDVDVNDYAITPQRFYTPSSRLPRMTASSIRSTSSQLTNGVLLGGLRFPHTMALMCKHWGDVVFSSPGLWTRIFSFLTNSNVDIHILSCQLEKTASYTVDWTMFGYSNSHPEGPTIIFWRFRSLRIKNTQIITSGCQDICTGSSVYD